MQAPQPLTRSAACMYPGPMVTGKCAAAGGHDSCVFYISNVALSRLRVTIILFCFAPNREMLCPSSEQNHLPGWSRGGDGGRDASLRPTDTQPSSVINKTATHSSCLEPSSQSSFIRRTDLHNGLVIKLQTNLREERSFTITEKKAPNRACSWLTVPTTAFTFETL